MKQNTIKTNSLKIKIAQICNSDVVGDRRTNIYVLVSQKFVAKDVMIQITNEFFI